MHRKARSAKIQYDPRARTRRDRLPETSRVGVGGGAPPNALRSPSKPLEWQEGNNLEVDTPLRQPKRGAKVPPSRSQRPRRPRAAAPLTRTAPVKCFHSGKMKCFAR